MRLRDEQKLEAIKKYSVQMIGQYGFQAFSLQKLSKKANISPATVYIYFKDKEDLLQKLFIEENSKMWTATLLGFDLSLSFADGLARQWKNRAEYFLANPQSLFFMEQIRNSPSYFSLDEADHVNTIGIVKAFVEKAIEQKQLKALPIEVYWVLAFAPLYQLLRFHISGYGLIGMPYKIEDHHIELALESVLVGLKPN